jgi:hypothetical protein
MNAAPGSTHDSPVAATIAGIDAEIERLLAERDVLIAAAAPTDEGDPAKTAITRRALAARLFGVVLPAGTDGAQVVAFAQTTTRFDDLADELAALDLDIQPQRWRSGGVERRALQWSLGGVTYSLHTPRIPTAPNATPR